MADVAASLGINVDSSQVAFATLALNDLADAAERAAAALEKVKAAGASVVVRRVGDIEYTTIDGRPA